MRYTLRSPNYQQQVVGLPGRQPVAVREKLADLKELLQSVIDSGFEWHVIDAKKPDTWMDRETVLRVCGIE